MYNKKWKQVSKTIGALFIDLGKLVFGSLILGSVLKGGVDIFLGFLFGTGLAILSFVTGILLISISEE